MGSLSPSAICREATIYTEASPLGIDMQRGNNGTCKEATTCTVGMCRKAISLPLMDIQRGNHLYLPLPL